MASLAQEHLENSQSSPDKQEVLHELRKSIDALIQWTGQLKEDRSSGYGREIALVHTKLQEAKMWAGKCLEMLGSELPAEFQDKA